MTYSLNEISSLAKKAGKGAGYDWGLSEEIGASVRWLFRQGLDGAKLLAQLLPQGYANDLSAHSPTLGQHVLECNGWLCPIVTGTMLCETFSVPKDTSLRIIQLDAPALLLPFIAHISQRLGQPITIDSDGVTAVIHGDELSVHGVLGSKASVLTITLGGEISTAQTKCQRAQVSDKTYDELAQFAARTYAPATEQSRLLGAGAGILDND